MTKSPTFRDQRVHDLYSESTKLRPPSLYTLAMLSDGPQLFSRRTHLWNLLPLRKPNDVSGPRATGSTTFQLESQGLSERRLARPRVHVRVGDVDAVYLGRDGVSTAVVSMSDNSVGANHTHKVIPRNERLEVQRLGMLLGSDHPLDRVLALIEQDSV
jgi:hypothetical protein